ncbi:hypothetical protein GCM10023205_00300 [Yinghuangia aomiensis]|uniref:WXG100 family type VII secretion target n=1 Tax=Yinghuangia aomiensis TaxID=676205 RepID=A0ABP9GRS3_9ACTN
MATNVDGLSHHEIQHMVKPVNADRVMVAADRIRTAAARIKEAADGVLAKPGQIVWQGKAADTFRTWNEQVAKAGQDTAFYTDMVGMHLGILGSELADAMARMPAVPQQDMDKLEVLGKADPTVLAQVDPDTGKTGAVLKTELKATVEEAHQAALSQMRNIVMVYQSGIANIGGLSVPGFPPPGNPFGYEPSPEDVGAATGVAAATAAGLLAAHPDAGTGAPPHAGTRIQGAVSPTQAAWPGTPGGAVPQVVTTDHQVGFAPGGRPVNTAGSSPLPDATTLAGGSQAQPNVTAPGSSPPGGVGQGDPQGMRSSWGGSPVVGKPAAGMSERQQSAPSRSGTAGLRGEEVSGGISRFAKPGEPGGPGAPMRGGVPMGGAPGGMPTGGGGPRGGRVGGARPVGMPGGIVGGRPSSSEGNAGRAVFSPGGSGLRADRAETAGRAGGGTRVEPGSAGRNSRVGPMGGGQGPSDSEPGRRRARRPDYLQADEDDWDGRGPGAVPPVIG